MGEGSQEHPEAKSEAGPQRGPRSAFDGWKPAGAYTSLPEGRPAPARANWAGPAVAVLVLAGVVFYSGFHLDRATTAIGTQIGPQSLEPARLSAPMPSAWTGVSQVQQVQHSPLPIAGEEIRESGPASDLQTGEASSAKLIPLFAVASPAAAPRLRPMNVTGFADYETGPTGLRRTRIRQDTRIYFQTSAAQQPQAGAGGSPAQAQAAQAARPGQPSGAQAAPFSRTRIAQQGRGVSGQVPGGVTAGPTAQGFTGQAAALAQGAPDCPACQDPSALRSSQAQVPGHWGSRFQDVVVRDMGACEDGRIYEIQNRSSGGLGAFRLTSDAGETWNVGAMNPGQSVRFKSQAPGSRLLVEFGR